MGSQVTSDCRPWVGQNLLACCRDCGVVQKPVTPGWISEIQSIYSGYAVYSQAAGSEQASFDAASGVGTARSRLITRWLKDHAHLSQTGRLLDIGCGNGGFLTAFGDVNSLWRMVGSELDDRNRLRVESIPGVERFYTGPIDSLVETFDLIVLVHALEHIPDPTTFLKRLRARLNPGGKVLIQVPDLRSSPFDILIADHCTHFSSATLHQSVTRAGYGVCELHAGVIAKELTLLASPVQEASVQSAASTQEAPMDHEHARRQVEWLHNLLAQARSIGGALGVFGTSISATWLAFAMCGRVSFFVDEDPARIGGTHLGLPIHKVEAVPSGSSVLMPMRPDIAANIVSRQRSTATTLIVPPSLSWSSAQ